MKKNDPEKEIAAKSPGATSYETLKDEPNEFIKASLNAPKR